MHQHIGSNREGIAHQCSPAAGRAPGRPARRSSPLRRRVPLLPIAVDALRRRRVQALAERLPAGELCPDGAACKRSSLARCPRWHRSSYEGSVLTGYVFLSLVGTLLEKIVAELAGHAKITTSAASRPEELSDISTA